MAERPGELNNIDKLDRISTAAGSDPSFDKYADGDPDAGSEKLAMNSDSEVSEQTELIKVQIEETRANMGETIDAIQERLSFTKISEQVSDTVNNAIEAAKETAYDATIGKAVNFMKNAGNEISHSTIVTAAKENPLPFILIGLGAGLLAYNGFGKKTRSFDRRLDDGSTAHLDSPDSKRSFAASAQQTAGGIKDSVSNAAGTAYEGVANAASSTYSETGHLANRAYEKAGEFGTKAQDTYNHYLEEKPWAIGAVALAAGAAVGLAIPSTRYEGELMGEARVNLMEKAQDTAGDLVDKAKQVASEAGKTINKEFTTAAKEDLNH